MTERGQLPKAYLRVDPNIDQTHPDNLDDFVRLLCAANRQPRRGTFKSRAVLEAGLGKTTVRHLYARGDVVDQDDGRVVVPGWDHWQEGDLDVAERMRRLRARQRTNGVTEAIPTVTKPVTDAVTKPIPTSEASRRQASSSGDEGRPRSLTTSARRPAETTAAEPRLTKDQLEAWSSFSRSEWQPFQEAWLARGLRWPPSGETHDPKSQRGILWQIAEARPKDLARWIAEAKGPSPADVIAHVLLRWHEIRTVVADREAVEQTPRRSGSRSEPTPLGALLPKVAR